MTTFASWSSEPAPWDRIGSRKSENLEDRFWAALNFSIDGGSPGGDYNLLQHSEVGGDMHLAFPTTSVPLLIDHDYNERETTPASSNSLIKASKNRNEPRYPLRKSDRKNSGSLRLQVPSSDSCISSMQSPNTRSPVPSSANRFHWHLPTPGSISPTTPALALVSNFLDSIVRISESRSSTPQTALPIGDDGQTLIVESEVLIHVIEDSKRMNPYSPESFDDENNLEKLQIPQLCALAFPSGVDAPLTELVANGPAGCAQELDALWWMSWDRQLSNVQNAFWH